MIQVNKNYFDTITFKVDNNLSEKIKAEALKHEINLNYFIKDHISISLNEITTFKDVEELISVFALALGKQNSQYYQIKIFNINLKPTFDEKFIRTSKYLEHPVFNSYRSETDILRYMKYLGE